MRKMTWLVIAVLLFATGALCLAGCGSSTSSKSSADTSSKSNVTEADLGVPIYPGAKQVDSQSMGPGQSPGSDGMQPPPDGATPPQGSAPNANGQGTPPNAGRGMGTAFQTSDSYDTVVAWYKDKLSGKSGFEQQAMPSPSQGQTQGGTSSNINATVFTFTSGSTTKMVMIRQDTSSQGGTYITIGDAPSGAPSGQQSNQTAPSGQNI